MSKEGVTISVCIYTALALALLEVLCPPEWNMLLAFALVPIAVGYGLWALRADRD